MRMLNLLPRKWSKESIFQVSDWSDTRNRVNNGLEFMKSPGYFHGFFLQILLKIREIHVGI